MRADGRSMTAPKVVVVGGGEVKELGREEP